MGKISRIKEDFLLNLDSNQISTRDMLADLQSELTTLSSDVRNSTPVSGKKDLPLLIVKEFDSAYLRILRPERVVSSALKANHVLTRDDGVTLLRQYPLSDLRLVQRNLIDSYADLNLLALEVESELEESDEFYMLILLLAIFGASAIAILSSYRVYRHSIVIPLESISSIALAIPIINGRGINGAADHVDSLVNTVELLSRPSHAAHEIKTLRHAVAALMSRLVQSFETLNLLSLTDPLCQVGNRRALELYGTKAWQQASRSDCPIGLLMIDVDYFKQFNDYYGYARGDQVCLFCQVQWLRPHVALWMMSSVTEERSFCF